jgi:AcrR family transcriptional regulator
MADRAESRVSAANTTEAQEPARGAELLGRREARVRATRAALSAAALTLTTERGPDGVTIEEIVAHAGVSYRTFFNYFKTKDEAILGPMIILSAPERLSLRPPDESPLDALYAAMADAEAQRHVRDWMDRVVLVKEYPSLYPRYMAAVGGLESEVSRAIADRVGCAVTDIYPQMLAVAAVAATRVALERCVFRGTSAVYLEELRSAFDAIGGGFALPRKARGGRANSRRADREANHS